MSMKVKNHLGVTRLKDNIPNLLVWFVLCQPFIDVITSLSMRHLPYSITFGVVVRSLFMLLMALYVLFVSTHRHIRKLRVFVLILMGYILAYSINSFILKETRLFLTDFTGIIKTFYFPFVLLGILAITDDYRMKLKDSLFVRVAAIYAAVIFLTAITGTSYTSYDWGGGYKGLFFAANEVGAVMASLAPIVILSFVRDLSKAYSWAALALILFAGTFMGTKVPFFGVFIYVACIFAWSLLTLAVFRRPASKRVLLGAVVAAVMLFALFSISPVKNNLFYTVSKVVKSHESIGGKAAPQPEPAPSRPIPLLAGDRPVHPDQTYRSVLDEPGEGVPGSRTLQVRHVSAASAKKTGSSLLATEESLPARRQTYGILNRLLNNRLTFIEPIQRTFSEASLGSRMLGIGYSNRLEDGTLNTKLIEMDFLDIAYSHGYVGASLFFFPIIVLIMASLVGILKNFKAFLSSLEACTYTYSFFLLLGVAFLAGHTLVAPAVSIYIALTLVKMTRVITRLKSSGTSEETVLSRP